MSKDTEISDEPCSQHRGAKGSLLTQYQLTAREFEVLTLLAQGMSNREIAVALCIAYDTANQHVKNLYRKLTVSNRVEAVLIYLQIKTENTQNR